jgi:hypothetical protein
MELGHFLYRAFLPFNGVGNRFARTRNHFSKLSTMSTKHEIDLNFYVCNQNLLCQMKTSINKCQTLYFKFLKDLKLKIGKKMFRNLKLLNFIEIYRLENLLMRVRKNSFQAYCIEDKP